MNISHSWQLSNQQDKYLKTLLFAYYLGSIGTLDRSHAFLTKVLYSQSENNVYKVIV